MARRFLAVLVPESGALAQFDALNRICDANGLYRVFAPCRAIGEFPEAPEFSSMHELRSMTLPVQNLRPEEAFSQDGAIYLPLVDSTVTMTNLPTQFRTDAWLLAFCNSQSADEHFDSRIFKGNQEIRIRSLRLQCIELTLDESPVLQAWRFRVLSDMRVANGERKQKK